MKFYTVLMPGIPEESPFDDVPLPGRLVRYRSTYRTSFPDPGMYEYIYDSMGRVEEMRGPARLDRWSFDERGRLTSCEYYDDHGLISPTSPYHVKWQFEYEGDATAAYVVHYFADEVSTGDKRYEIVNDRVMGVNLGEAWQETYAYDSAGNHVRSFEWTLTVGGPPTYAYFARYEDPHNPALPTWERRADGFGVNWGLDWRYDEHGRPIQMVEGDDVETWTYGGPGGTDAWYRGGAGLTRWENNHPWLGLTDFRMFEYDDQGRPVRWHTEYPGLGSDTVTAVYTVNVDCDSELPPGLDTSDGR
ncbi:MAG: hypothetical protein KC621_03640 [Myxococcales bacterium]|nr:hypothetical protein [Myxococcales bacterium]